MLLPTEVTANDWQTFCGWSWVSLQIAAAMRFAEPRTAWATGLPGRRISAAICAQVRPKR